jgi:hypothetical protein
MDVAKPDMINDVVSTTISDTIITNFEELRARSIKLWTGIEPEHYTWRPDDQAFSCIEMMRHVLETEHIYHELILRKGSLGDFISPWERRPFVDVQDELDFAISFRKAFFDTIRNFTLHDLVSIQIVRKDRKTRNVGNFLNRCAYHEAVHAGQFLSYMRTIGISRPNIWD